VNHLAVPLLEVCPSEPYSFFETAGRFYTLFELLTVAGDPLEPNFNCSSPGFGGGGGQVNSSGGSGQTGTSGPFESQHATGSYIYGMMFTNNCKNNVARSGGSFF
jgi:hypothetical protein